MPSVFETPEFQNYIVVAVTTIDELKNFVVNDLCQVVIVDFNTFKCDENEALGLCKTLNPKATRIVSKETKDAADIADAVNKYKVFKYINSTDDKNIGKYIYEVSDQFFNFKGQQIQLADVKKQNLLLEEMTMSLEKTIDDRTHDLEKAKKAVEEHVQTIRGINKFLLDLSSLVSVEEILLVLKNEFKKFHKILPPILAIQATNDTPKLIYFNGGNIHTHIISKLWPDVIDIRKNNILDQEFLANELGRPLGPVLSVPLNSEHGNYVLFIESTLNEDEMQSLFAFLGDRLKAVTMTLERIVLDQEIRSASYMWEATFDGIEAPIAIIDKSFQVLRGNRYFSADKKICYRSLGGENKVCKGCPVNEPSSLAVKSAKISLNQRTYFVHSYPISEAGDASEHFVNHYVDTTRSEKLAGQIIQNEKMSAVGHLADHIAHELNNPLTGIRSLSQVLIGEVSEEGTLKSDLIEVEKASMRCQRIINNLLDFSKGSEPSSHQSISISEVINKTLPFLKAVTGYFEQEIDLIDDDTVFMDSQLLQQVVFNLINNACQSMGEKGKLVIQTKKYSRDSDVWIELSVKDTGSGISGDNLKKVFAPFYTTKKEGEGTGLGLSVCKSIIEKYGGIIDVKSRLGVGSTFYVHLKSEEQ